MKAPAAALAAGALLSACASSTQSLPAPGAPAPSVCADAPGPFRFPILLYHRIAIPAAEESPARLSLFCPPALFSAQLNALVASGYQTVTLRDVEQILAGRECAPLRPVVLTFDDGTADHRAAAQELSRRGLRGVFFVVTDWLDDATHVTSPQLLEMRRLGMEIGSHSRRHPDLRQLSAQQKSSEIRDSKRRLEKLLQEEVLSFAYPGGAFDLETAGLVGEAGYRFARATTSGIARMPPGRLELPVIHMLPETSAAELLRQLEAGR